MSHIVLPLFIVAAWIVLSSLGLLNPYLIPSPARIWTAAKNLIASNVVQGKTSFRSVNFSQPLDDKFLALAAVVRDAVASAGFNLLALTELEERMGVPPSEFKRVMAYLREQDDLRILEGGLLFSQDLKDRLLAVLASMQEDITVASLRDCIDISRKYARPMLEFLDSQGLTQRTGDKRILKNGGGV